MEVERIEDGLWRWTGFHEEWKQDVGCVYVESEDAVCLIDPLVPPEDRERFLAALDRDVLRLGLPVHVLVTVFWHTRNAREIAERYGAEIWAPSRARPAVERRAGTARPFRPGDSLPGGIEAHVTARSNEVVLFLPRHAALVAGDVLLGSDDGLRLCPDSWLPDGVGQDALRTSLLPLLDLPVRHVLVSHGRPAIGNGAAALRAALT
ncbi:MAG TPA: MBL fold metallo-hydrolase [Gaiellaceae bacterium]|nr:MBL fold metallo-hydrolase [Gaiellaceae bacterium]